MKTFLAAVGLLCLGSTGLLIAGCCLISAARYVHDRACPCAVEDRMLAAFEAEFARSLEDLP